MTRWLAVLAVSACLTGEAQTGASRGDLALAYMHVERALAAQAESALPERTRTNQAFDKATLAFFSGATRGALKGLRGLALELEGKPPAGEAVEVQLVPAVWVRGEPAPQLKLKAARDFALGFRLRRDQVVITEFSLDPGATSARVPTNGLQPGAYTLERAPSGIALARLNVCAVDPDLVSRKLAQRTERLPAGEARDILQARLKLLTRRLDPQDTTQFLADLAKLTGELTREVKALEAGRDPYRQRSGSCWRPFASGSRTIGLRVYGPVGEDTALRPLVVAFHGAGGDENMFAWGYGGGRLERLAELEGFVLATPRTEVFVRNPAENFDALLATVARDYRVDRRRVFLVGHSLGVLAIDGVLRQRKDRVAGALCFSGMPRATNGLPTQVFLGERDPLVPARLGRNAKPEVTVEVLPGYGHTLGVGPQLSRGVRWLLSQSGWL